MLTFFPDLLAFTFFTPLLFRLTVAGVFIYLVFWHFKRKREVASEFEPMLRGLARPAVGLLILLELAVAAGFFLGAWTQIMAILGILGFAKMALFKNRFPTYSPLSRISYLLLIVICFSLLITGAGAFAFDLPL